MEGPWGTIVRMAVRTVAYLGAWNVLLKVEKIIQQIPNTLTSLIPLTLKYQILKIFKDVTSRVLTFNVQISSVFDTLTFKN